MTEPVRDPAVMEEFQRRRARVMRSAVTIGIFSVVVTGIGVFGRLPTGWTMALLATTLVIPAWLFSVQRYWRCPACNAPLRSIKANFCAQCAARLQD